MIELSKKCVSMLKKLHFPVLDFDKIWFGGTSLIVNPRTTKVFLVFLI